MTASIFVISRQVLFCVLHAHARRILRKTSQNSLYADASQSYPSSPCWERSSLWTSSSSNGGIELPSESPHCTVQRRLHGNRNYLSWLSGFIIAAQNLNCRSNCMRRGDWAATGLPKSG